MERTRAPITGADLAPAPAEAFSAEELTAEILDELDKDAPEQEPDSDRIRRRVTALIKRAEDESLRDRHSYAIVSPRSRSGRGAGERIAAQKAIHRHRDLFFEIYQRYLGDMEAIPASGVARSRARQTRHG